jgi:hypothetical protein
MVSLGGLGWIAYCAGDSKWYRCEELERNCPNGQHSFNDPRYPVDGISRECCSSSYRRMDAYGQSIYLGVMSHLGLLFEKSLRQPMVLRILL